MHVIQSDIGRRLAGLIALGVALFVCPAGASAQQVLDSASALKGIDVVEHLGDTIPLDLPFTDDQGNAVTLRDYFHKGKPVVMTLSYTNCPMLCSVVLDGLSNSVHDMEWRPGTKFQMLNVSIDPTETVEMTRQRKTRYLESVGPLGQPDGWAFLVGDEANVKTLANAIGFKYYYDEKIKQYAHPAVVFVLTEDGVVSRYLYGISYPKRDLRLSLLEASEGKIGSTIDRIILYCYHYDPDAQGYSLFAGNVMRVGGILTVIFLGLFLGIYWVRDRVRHHQHSHHPHAA